MSDGPKNIMYINRRPPHGTIYAVDTIGKKLLIYNSNYRLTAYAYPVAHPTAIAVYGDKVYVEMPYWAIRFVIGDVVGVLAVSDVYSSSMA